MQQLFEQEYKKHEKALFLVALAYLHNTEDAKDVLQEAAIAAYQSFDKLRNREYFKTWLTRIVINKSKNFLKSKRPMEEFADSLNIFCTLPTEELEILDAVCRLKAEYALYISLRFYSGMNYAEVAKLLALPVSTVKYRTHRALEELKSLLEGEA